MKFESLEITDDIRAVQLGNFVKISDGTVYYELGGPKDGEIVVLIHGLITPLFCWDPTFEMLTNEGFQVLRYDLFGRGYSSRPKVKYDQDLFDRQLFELLTELKLTHQKINLVGISLGGAICAIFAVHHTELVKRICLVDPAYPSKRPTSLKILRIPVLNRIIFKFVGHKKIISGLSNNFYQYDNFPQYEQKFTEQMKYKGFGRALMSTAVNFNLGEIPEIYEQVGKLKLPVQLFWGEHDKLVPYETNKKLQELIPDIQFHSIEGAGHLSHYERPDLVNPLLLKFLKG